MTRWRLYLNQFDIKIQYLKGENNKIADILSRRTDQTIDKLTNINNITEVGTDSLYANYPIQILEDMHDNKLSGHLGILKTYELIRRNFPDAHVTRKTVEEYIRSCERCQMFKSNNQTRKGLLQPIAIPDDSFQDLTLDLVNGIQGSDIEYILVVVDKFSKMVFYFPFPKTPTARQIFKTILSGIFVRFGFPKSIITDRGPQFKGGQWQVLLSEFDIKAKMATTNHPQTDGQSEREIRQLLQYLRLNLGKNQKVSDILPYAEFSSNNSVKKSTGFTPLQMVLHKKNLSPKNNQLIEYLDPKEILEKARTNLKKSQENMKKQADKHRVIGQELNVGDLVLVSITGLKPTALISKMDPKYIGPCLVKSKTGKDNYRIQLPSEFSGKFDNFHISFLKKFIHRNNQISNLL
jgi:putative transposase